VFEVAVGIGRAGRQAGQILVAFVALTHELQSPCLLGVGEREFSAQHVTDEADLLAQ
jgi:hypothetical protein